MTFGVWRVAVVVLLLLLLLLLLLVAYTETDLEQEHDREDIRTYPDVYKTCHDASLSSGRNDGDCCDNNNNAQQALYNACVRVQYSAARKQTTKVGREGRLRLRLRLR